MAKRARSVGRPSGGNSVGRSDSAKSVGQPKKKKSSSITKKDSAGVANDVEVESSTESTPDTPAASPIATSARSHNHMDLTLKRSTAPRKDNRLVIYNFTDRAGSVQFLATLFGGTSKTPATPPDTLVISGEFAEAKPKVDKIKETKEERKARLAALPKPTLAEKVARAEKRTEELRAKLAKQAATAGSM